MVMMALEIEAVERLKDKGQILPSWLQPAEYIVQVQYMSFIRYYIIQAEAVYNHPEQCKSVKTIEKIEIHSEENLRSRGE